MLKGLKLREVDANFSRARFVFLDPDGRADALVSAYWTSAACQFVAARMSLRRELRLACPTFAASSFEDRHP